MGQRVVNSRANTNGSDYFNTLDSSWSKDMSGFLGRQDNSLLRSRISGDKVPSSPGSAGTEDKVTPPRQVHAGGMRYHWGPPLSPGVLTSAGSGYAWQRVN